MYYDEPSVLLPRISPDGSPIQTLRGYVHQGVRSYNRGNQEQFEAVRSEAVSLYACTVCDRRWPNCMSHQDSTAAFGGKRNNAIG